MIDKQKDKTSGYFKTKG